MFAGGHWRPDTAALCFSVCQNLIGIARIKTGYDPFEMNKLFARLEDIHLGRLKEQQEVPEQGLQSPTGKTLDELLDEHSATKKHQPVPISMGSPSLLLKGLPL